MSKTLCRRAAGFIAGIIFGANAASGADSPAKFLGAQSCASSGCHGGGGAKQNQVLTWSLKDFHSQRPTATLTTARSMQIAEALAIKDPTADARCTSCHAPLHEVPENLRGDTSKVSEGISCESCHGPAENWLRSHTRKDYTRADRTAAGMRDLRNLYVRANTCVACHQNVDGDILKAGHPELFFELDGQSVAEPKHWQEGTNWNGAQAWLVGQAVALRELSWQLDQEKVPDGNLTNRQAALRWMLDHVSIVIWLPAFDYHGTRNGYDRLRFDSGASNAATFVWEKDWTNKLLLTFASLSKEFRDETISKTLHARRAERLVLALDRLAVAENNHKADAELNQLFKLAQSIPDFDPKQFAAALEKFAAALPPP